jgi:hypothetical protein
MLQKTRKQVKKKETKRNNSTVAQYVRIKIPRRAAF